MPRKTVNYATHTRGWGHDFAITKVDGNVIQATGWYSGPGGSLLEVGDFVLFPNEAAPQVKTSRYIVKEIERFPSPRDMWAATLEFCARPKPMGEAEAYSLAESWFAGRRTDVPYLAKLLVEERCKEFGVCSEVVIGAYVDFLKGTEPK